MRARKLATFQPDFDENACYIYNRSDGTYTKVEAVVPDDVYVAKSGYPVVPCVHEFTDLSGIRRVKLVCPYCHKVHRHGSGKTFGAADGEFRSNCGGYYLKEVSNPALAGFSPDLPGAHVMVF